MKPAIVLRKKLASQDLVLGVLMTNHIFMELIEVSQAAGMDYAIIDLEHMDHGGPAVSDALRLARALNFPVLIRPNETSYDAVRLALDLGPCGLLLPMVESAADLDNARDGMYLPKRGRRRPGGPGNRWVDSYTGDVFRSVVEENLVVIPQIENLTGLKNVDTIARHEITTAMGIGPYDLSANLGICGQMMHPDLIAAQTQIQEAAKRAGKTTWIVGDTTLRRSQGFRFICVAEPIMLLESTLRKIATTAHENHRAENPGN